MLSYINSSKIISLLLQWVLTNSCVSYCTEISLGFEFEDYVFREPPQGTNQIPRQICVTVKEGSVGTTLVVTPRWAEDTATSKEPFFEHNYCVKAKHNKEVPL